MNRRARSNGRLALGLAVLASTVVSGACRGENLFSLAGTVAGSEPQILLTAPAPDFTTAIGDSVLVLAEITAQEGLTTVDFRGEYVEDGGDAYLPESQPASGATVFSVNNYLNAVDGQEPGDAYIVIEASDAAGQVARDSVKITISGD